MGVDYVPPELRGHRPAEPSDDDDRLVDGRRIADVLREDEDAAFDEYMSRAFGVGPDGRPAKPTTSHIAAEPGVYETPADE